jgi:hypothetical protein
VTATTFTRRRARWAASLAVAGVLALAACGDDGGDGPFASDGGGDEFGREELAAELQAESGGLLTDEEADCIAGGVLDFAPDDIEAMEDLDFDDMPAEQQGAWIEMITDCVPAEKLMQLGEL